MFRTLIDRLFKRDRSASRKLSRSERRAAFLQALQSRTSAEVATWTSVFRNIVKHETRRRSMSFQSYLLPALQLEALEDRRMLALTVDVATLSDTLGPARVGDQSREISIRRDPTNGTLVQVLYAGDLTGTGSATNVLSSDSPDLTSNLAIPDNLGSIGLGRNVVQGSLNASLVDLGGGFLSTSGDDADSFEFVVPDGLLVTNVELVVTNYATNAGATARVRNFSGGTSVERFSSDVTYVNLINTPDQTLGPGTYDLQAHTELDEFSGSAGDMLSLNYRFNITAARLLASQPLSGVSNVMINGSGGDDMLTVNYAAGLPNITFNGGGGNDDLDIDANGNDIDITLNNTTAESGDATIGTTLVDWTDIEPNTVTVMGGATITVDLDSSDTVNFTRNSATVTRVTGNTNTVTFTTPSTQLIVNDNDDSTHIVTFTDFADDFNATTPSMGVLYTDGAGQDDTASFVTNAQSLAALDVTAGSLTATTAALTITGTTTVDTGAAGDVLLNDTGHDFQGNVTVTNALNATFVDMDAIAFAGAVTQGFLNVTAGDAITESGQLDIAGAATFVTQNNAGANITLNSTATHLFGNLTARTLDAVGAAATPGTINIVENATTSVALVQTTATATLTSAGTINSVTDDATADVVAATINLIAAVGGIGTASILDVTATTQLNADTVTGDDGNIVIDSIGNATVGLIDAGAGNVTLDSTGDIDSTTDDGTADVVGATVNLLAAVGGIGTGSILDVTATTQLNADTVTGDDGNIVIDSIGNATVGLIDAGAGNVTLDSTGDIDSTADDGTADVVGATVNLLAAVGGIGTGSILDVTATTQLNADTDAGDDANIVIDGIGTLPLGIVDAGTAGGNVTLDSTDQITDALVGDGAANANIIGSDLQLVAVNGVGATDAIDTLVARADIVNTTAGAVFVDNFGAFTLVDLNADTFSVSAPNSNGRISASSPLTIVNNASTGGNFTYLAADDATDGAGQEDNLVISNVNGAITVAADGNLTLQGGDVVQIQSTTNVAANNAGVLTIDVDNANLPGGNADVGGGNVIIAGNVSGANGIQVNGGTENDTFSVDSNAPNASIPLSAAELNDGGNVDGIMSNITFTAGGGATDTLNFDDSGDATADATIDINSAVAGEISGLVDAGSTITFDGTLEFLNVNHANTAAVTGDVVTVAPDAETTIFLNGNDPVAGSDPGDTINIDLTGLTDAVIELIPSRTGVFGTVTATGVMPLSFVNFESLNADGALFDLRIRMDLSTSANVGLNNGFADGTPGAGEQDEITVTQEDATTLNISIRTNPLGAPTTFDQIDITHDGSLTEGVRSLEIIGSGDNDILQLNETAAGLPSFTGDVTAAVGADADGHINSAMTASGLLNTDGDQNINIHFAGGGGVNSIGVTLLAAEGNDNSVAYFADAVATANSGNLHLSSFVGTQGTILSFANLAPLDITGAGAGDTLLVDASALAAAVNTFLSIDDDFNTPAPFSNNFGVSPFGAAVAAADGRSAIWGNGGFETTRFEGFGNVIMRSGLGADTLTVINLDMANANPLHDLVLDGDDITNSDASDDILHIRNLPDPAAALQAHLFGGQDGSAATGDTYNLFNGPTLATGTNTVDTIVGQVIVSADPTAIGLPAGFAFTDENGVGIDTLNIDDRGDTTAAADRVLIGDGDADPNAVTGNLIITGITGHAGPIANADIRYSTGVQVEVVQIWTSNTQNDEVDVEVTQSGTTYNLFTMGGDDDIFVFENSFAQTSPPSPTVANAHIDFIDGTLNINTGLGTDSLTVSDFGDAAGVGQTTGADDGADTYGLTDLGTTPGGSTELTFVDGASTVDIRYDANGTAGQLENFTLIGSNALTADNTYNIFATSATTSNTISDGDATVTGAGNNGTFEIDANQLQAGAANTFNGFDGNDTFNVDYNNASATGGTFVISGGANDTPLSDNRDLININNIVGARNTTFTYQAGAGEVDVTGLGTTLDADTVEQVNYNADAANNDDVTVNGRANTTDDLTVAPITANRALVFLDGDPWDGPNEGDLFDQFPGVAGGSNGPDIDLNGVSPTTLTVRGHDGTGVNNEDDQLYVYAPSQADLTDTTNTPTLDPFGFGVGVIIPGSDNFAGFNSAFDSLTISDTQVAIINDRLNTALALLPVNLVPTAGFVQTNPLDPGLIVSTGFEPTPTVDTDNRADIAAPTTSQNFYIQVNGGRPFDPGDVTAPVGDRIILNYPNGVQVYSDQADPPNVSTVGIGEPFGITFSSMEDVLIDTPRVDIIGDDNGNAPGQHDEYLVTGIADFDPGTGTNDGFQNDFLLRINDSSPITFFDVNNLNVYGTTTPTTPDENTVGSGNDRVSIQPYATNFDLWFVDVQVNLQDGDDRVAYTGVSGILDDILLDADFADLGEGRIFDDNVMGTFTGVAINFANTENVNVNANPNDGDLLTIRTTTQDDQLTLRFDPDRTGGRTGVDANTNTLGAPNDTRDDDIRIANHFDVVIDDGRGVHDLASLAATVTTPLDAAVANGFAAVVLDLQEGDDTVTVDLVAAFDDGDLAANDTANDATGGGAGTLPLNVTILAGPPNASDTLTIVGNLNQNDQYTVTPGVDVQSGTVGIAGFDTGEVSFTGIEHITINGGGGTGNDSLTMNGNGGNNVFTVTGLPGGGAARVDAGPLVTYSAFGSTDATVTLDGQQGTDSVTVNTTTAAETIAYTPTAANAGQLRFDPTNSVNDIELVDVEVATLNGLGGDDTFTFNGTSADNVITHTAGTAADAGAFAIDSLLGLSYEDLGIGATINVDGQGGTNTFVMLGGAGDDQLRLGNLAGGGVLAADVITGGDLLSQTVDHVNVNLTNVAAVTLDGRSGSDRFAVAPDTGLTTNVLGGDSDDTLLLDNAIRLTAVALDIDAGPSATVPAPAAKNGTLSETVSSTTIEYLGIEAVQILGSTAGVVVDTIRVTDDGGDNVWSIGSGEPVAGSPTVRVGIDDRTPLFIENFESHSFTNSEGGVDRFVVSPIGLPNAAAQSYTVTGSVNNDDTLEVLGSGNQDLFTLTNTTVNSGAGASVAYAIIGTIVLDGQGNDDTFTIDGTTTLVATPVHVIGGSGFDTLRVQSDVAGIDEAIYTPGPGLSDGLLRYENATDVRLMSITFTGLEPVQDAVTATTLTVNGTPGNNAINYSAGAGGGVFTAGTVTGLVSVDSFETIEFANKTNLVINAGVGSDSVNINNSTVPTGMVAATSTITVNNGDPTASDTLTVNAQAGTADTMVVVPSGTVQGAGTVDYTANNLPDVVYTGTEHINLVGQLADGGPAPWDTFGVDGTAGNDTFEYFSGVTVDTGTVRGTLNLGPGTGVSLPTINFSNMHPAMMRPFNSTANQGGADTFVFVATDSDDTIGYANGVLTNGFGATTFATLNVGTPVNQTVGVPAGGTTTVVIQGGDGADTFNITADDVDADGVGTAETNVAIFVSGGQPDSGSDTLNFSATGDTIVELGSSTIEDAGVIGSPDVTYSGIETINVDANSNALTVEATTGDDTILVRPTGAATATVEVNGQPVVNGTEIGTFTVDADSAAGDAGEDTVIIEGDENGTIITVT
ncbi:MAG: hypothetical protein O3C40_00510, partial [Planctomycetota bacterium]|nr:hypothetical protein [Planctomycetota bacterium]